MLYYFVEFAGSFANIALLLLFIGRLFPKKEPVSRWFYAYVALLIAGQCALSLFPDWVTQRTIYLLVGGFFLALLFYEVRPWQAVFASGAFFTLIALVEVLAMLLIGLRIPDTDILMQAGAARLVYVVFSNLIQIPLVVLISHFFSRKGNALRILWLLPIIAIQIASIAVCYVAQYHAVDEYFPDYMVGLMAVLLLINILIVFYVEALRENELEKFKVKQNIAPSIENYEILYRGNLPEGKRSVPQAELLEQLYQKFNFARPTDYHGHSLSVSDVIMLNQDGKISAHYVDSIGFKELPGFLDKKPERPSVLMNLKEKCDAPESNPTVCRKARDVHEL